MSAIDTAPLAGEAPARLWTVRTGQIALALLLLVVWEVAARRLGLLFLAGPIAVAERLARIAWSGELLRHIAATLEVAAAGFAIGAAAGIAVPFLLLRSRRLTRAVEPYILVAMGIPKFALAPLLVLWFGIGFLPKIIIVTLLTFFVIFVGVFAGIRAVDQRLVNMARIVGAGEMAIAREVMWNSALPYIFSSLKVALPRAVSAAIVGEFIVADRGLGYYIDTARQSSDTVGVFTGILVATAIVLALDAGLGRLQRRSQAWRPVERDMAL